MMKETASYSGEFHSVFGPRLEEYLQLKRAAGFTYARSSSDLRIFDRYCTEWDLKNPVLEKRFIDDWIRSLDSQPEYYRKTILNAVRGFAAFLNTMDGDSVLILRIPEESCHPFRRKPATEAGTNLPGIPA